MALRDNQATVNEYMSWVDDETGLTVQLRPREVYPNKPIMEPLPQRLDVLFPNLRSQL
jgi:hypothetical protein